MEFLSIDGNISWYFNCLLGIFAQRFPKETQLAIYIYSLLKDHNEYFSQDLELHRYCECFGRLSSFQYDRRYNVITISPLCLLYFFLLVQSRFINTFLPDKTESNGGHYNLFIHGNYDMNGNFITSVKVLKILDGRSVTEFISIQNKEMKNILKNILAIYKDKLLFENIVPYDDIIGIMYEVINVFIGIYKDHVNYKESHLFDFLAQVKSLNDFYEQLSLGKPHAYVVSEDSINAIQICKQRLDTLQTALFRLKIEAFDS
jgi:hypothetical protein